MRFRARLLLLAFIGLGHGPASVVAAEPAGVEFFETKIRPVLVENCYECHSAQAQELKGGLRLDSAAGVVRGGETGPVIVPGKPAESRLIRAIRYLDADLQMPPRRRLSPQVIADFEKWVAMGAPDPREGEAPQTARPQGIDYEAGRQFWSFQPIRDPRPPQVRDTAWVASPLDRFILARLEARDLPPAPAADRRTLIRRVYFDLIGLPPTPQEVAAFLADDSPDALAVVIDRLLESPAYGERWGRHWLDIARYTDSFDRRFMGQPFDVNHAWRYRDWVVDAFNRDHPYDQFIVDQIAGDILVDRGGRPEQLVATGVLAIGEWGTGDSDKRKMMTDIVDDQIDFIGRGVMGLTLACARCHDHKFDPLSTQDYYALAGFFFSSHILPGPGLPTNASDVLSIPKLTRQEREQHAALERQRDELQAAVEALRKKAAERFAQELRDRTTDYLAAVQAIHRAGGAVDLESIAMRSMAGGLNPVILQRWLGYLGLPDGAQPHLAGLMTQRLTELFGRRDLPGWGEPNTPWIITNPHAEDQRVLTLRVPARGVAVHPGPDRPVAIGWRSPVSGAVHISGRIESGDGNCGDGVAWVLEARRAGRGQVLASGSLDRGAMQTLAPHDVELAIGDMLSLVIDPRGNHSCDTTIVELAIQQTDGDDRRSWNLAADVVDDIHSGNPHADSHGHPGVWHFYTLSGPPPSQQVVADSALGRWVEALLRGAQADELADLAQRVQAGMTAGAPAAPDPSLHEALAAPDGVFMRGIDVTVALAAEQQQSLRQFSQRLGDIRAELSRPVTVVHGIQEGGVPTSEHEGFADARVHIRGSYARLGDVVPRGFPHVLAGGARPRIPDNSSGRLQLAQWLVSDEHPLTARVMVNRIWQQHFGEGLVRTPDNFGTLGEAPTHPQLLDWLASRFIESGWSIKSMHRLIMLSATYRQSSFGEPRTMQADPENRLIGRMNRRRLEVESLRDALLALSGRLDRSMGGPAAADLMVPRRTLYIATVRSDGSTFRDLFDAADPSAIIARRNESTVAPQSLWMLNHPFVLEQTGAMARRLLDATPVDPRQRIATLYEWCFARRPTAAEMDIGLSLVGDTDTFDAWRQYCQVLICTNEFMYVD